jgi:phosphoribosyl 1,2-cyclic phosphate phosphodiesterase
MHIEENGVSLVIDTGPDFRQQMLREQISHLDAILFTHEHKDHTAGLDDVRAFNFKQGDDIPLYARDQVIEQLKQEFSYAFAENKYPGVPRIRTHEIDNTPFEVGGVEVIPLEVIHYKLPVFGFRIGDFSYITDASVIPDAAMSKIQGSEVLVLNALQKQDHISHFTLAEAVEIAGKVGAKATYFTHLSHRMGRHGDIEDELPENVFIAYDGLTLSL